jgi:triacylglycerol lipase
VRIFLIHGMGRTGVSFALLARRLKAAGHEVATFNYFVTRETLEGIAERFVTFVAERAGTAPYAVVGHSLGNVVTRLALPSLLGSAQAASLERFIMLAPPNQPPVIARALEKNPVFRVLTRDAGRKLLDDEFYARLPVPAVPTLVIAGNRGPKAAWLPFRGEPSDGVVKVAETHLPGASTVAHVEVRAIHTFIMNEAEVALLVLRFLERGTLLGDEAVRAAAGGLDAAGGPSAAPPDSGQGEPGEPTSVHVERLPVPR